MNRIKYAAIATAFCFVALLIWSIATRHSRPVLVHLPIPIHSVRWDTDYAVFNPFRDRTPELVAKAYTEAMQRGDCAESARHSRNAALPNNMTCTQMLAEYRNSARFVQILRDRFDRKNEVILHYSDDGYLGNWVTVRRFGDSWSVVEFNKFW